ncbi:translocation/assembly module TamB domain-containing protein [Paremcibacter congregatus]|uniref:translocation/assembly module TamB domain-containing protein n=1 Tax=Paremcibacter congregatus TaxID=2043170 RepID=UPI003A91E0CB
MKFSLTDIKSLSGRRVGKIIAKVSGGALALLFILLIGTALYLDTPSGHKRLTTWIENSLRTPDQTVRLSPIEGSLFTGFRLADITFSDREGPWLTLTDVDLDWSPSALLRQKIMISRLQVATARLVRLPESTDHPQPATTAPMDFTLPRLPVDAEIADFGLNQFLLGQKVVGIRATFTGQGALKLTRRDGILLRLDLINQGASQDEISARIAYPGPTENLSVDVTARAPEGGIFSRMIGTTPTQDVVARLTGDGPLEDWRGSFRLQVGETTIADASLRNTDKAFTLRGMLDSGDMIPEDSAALLGRTARLSVDLTPSPTDTRTILDLKLVADTLTLTAQGAVTGDATASVEPVSFSLDLTNAAPVNKMFAPMRLMPFTLSGKISDITGNSKLQLTTQGLRAGYGADISGRLSGQIRAETEGQRITFSAKGKLDELSGTRIMSFTALTAPGLDWSLNGHANQDSGTLSLSQARLNNSRFDSEMTATFNRSSGDLSARITTALSRLSDLIPSSNGGLTSVINLSREDPDAALTAAVTVTARQLDLGDATASALFGPTPVFSAHISRMADGALNLKQARLNAAHLTLTADAHLSPQQVIRESNFHLVVTDLADLSGQDALQMDGGIEFTGQLSGPVRAPALTLETGIKALTLQDVTLQNVTARLEATDIIQRPAGSATLHGESDYGPLQGGVTFTSPTQELIRLSDLTLTFGALRAAGQIDLPKGRPALGRINLLTAGTDLAANAIKGTLSAEITLGEQDGAQQITVQGRASEMALRTGPRDLTTLKEATLSGDILLMDKQPRISLTADFTALSHPRLQASEGHLRITQQEEDKTLSYDLALRGNDIMPYDLTLFGTAPQPTQAGRDITLGFTGTVDQTPVALKQPVTLSLRQTGFSLTPFKVELGKGHISGRFTRANKALQASLTADNADLRPLLVFAPKLPLVGLLNGTVRLNATENTTDGAFELRLTQIPTLVQGMAFQAQGTLAPSGLDLTGSARLNDQFQADFTARLPLFYDAAVPTFHFPADQPLSGQFSWRGAIDPLWPAFYLTSHDLGGDVTLDLMLGGTKANPDIDGHLSLKNGRYENLKSGFVATDLDMAATIADRKLTLDHLTAKDGGTGQLTASAEVLLNADLSYQARADLKIDKARLVRQPELDVTASADLAFLKSPAATYFKGDITVDKADIRAVNGGATAVPVLQVREINHPDQGPDTEPEQGRHLGPFPLGLTVKVPGRLFIRSYGMDSEWRADMTIGGTSDKPIVTGGAQLIRGTFDFAGKTFDLTRGSLTFPDDRRNDPLLDIMAELEMTDLTAQIAITGRASAPKLTVSASPDLPQDEVMSRILFGTSATELSAVEALQLAAAVHSLSNGGGPGLLGNVRSALGIDRLSIDKSPDRDQGTTITGGKYLTNNIYIEVTTAPATGETATSVEVSLSRSLSLITRQTMSHDRNLALRWSWRY